MVGVVRHGVGNGVYELVDSVCYDRHGSAEGCVSCFSTMHARRSICSKRY